MDNRLLQEPTVSFVLPAFNEGEFIEDALARLDSAARGGGLAYEIVVVDDGSIDDTRLRAWRYAARRGHVRVVSYDRNVGKGFAVKTGFWNAGGDVVVFADSDLDVDFGQVKRYVDALRFGDIVIGSKWCKDSVVEVSLLRKVLSKCFNVLVRLLTEVEVSDTQTGIKAIRRESFERVFRRMSVKRYAFDVELLVVARLYGLRVVELPVKLKLESRFRVREIWRMVHDLLGITYRLRVRQSYQRGFVEDSGS